MQMPDLGLGAVGMGDGEAAARMGCCFSVVSP